MSCAICMEQLQQSQQPKVLSCGHSFCLACIEHWFKSKQRRAPEDRSGRAVRCPVCLQNTPLPTSSSGDEGLASLPTNFALLEALEENSIKLCDDDDDDGDRSVSLMCSLHAGKILEFQCKTCDGQLICRQCVRSQHRPAAGHVIGSLASLVRRQSTERADLEQKVTELQMRTIVLTESNAVQLDLLDHESNSRANSTTTTNKDTRSAESGIGKTSKSETGCSSDRTVILGTHTNNKQPRPRLHSGSLPEGVNVTERRPPRVRPKSLPPPPPTCYTDNRLPHTFQGSSPPPPPPSRSGQGSSQPPPPPPLPTWSLLRSCQPPPPPPSRCRDNLLPSTFQRSSPPPPPPPNRSKQGSSQPPRPPPTCFFLRPCQPPPPPPARCRDNLLPSTLQGSSSPPPPPPNHFGQGSSQPPPPPPTGSFLRSSQPPCPPPSRCRDNLLPSTLQGSSSPPRPPPNYSGQGSSQPPPPPPSRSLQRSPQPPPPPPSRSLQRSPQPPPPPPSRSLQRSPQPPPPPPSRSLQRSSQPPPLRSQTRYINNRLPHTSSGPLPDPPPPFRSAGQGSRTPSAVGDQHTSCDQLGTSDAPRPHLPTSVPSSTSGQSDSSTTNSSQQLGTNRQSHTLRSRGPPPPPPPRPKTRPLSHPAGRST